MRSPIFIFAQRVKIGAKSDCHFRAEEKIGAKSDFRYYYGICTPLLNT